MELYGMSKLGRLKPRTSISISSSRLGVGFECLDREYWDPSPAWPFLSELGVKWARVQTGWARTEKEMGIYDFSWLDEIVNRIRECGLTSWFNLGYGNPLYTPEAPWHGVGYAPIHTEPERSAWQAYIRALVTHFKDRVEHYEVWNEPDAKCFFKPHPDPEAYADLVRLTAVPLREIQPDASIIAGAIAFSMSPWSLSFLEACFDHGMHEDIDIVSYHGYRTIPERNTEQEYPALRHLLRRYKPELKYWQGEAGMVSHIPDGFRGSTALTDMEASESIQARMLLRRFLIELGNDCGMVSWFHMADFGKYMAKQPCYYGLLRLADGSPKPSFYALQALATLLCDPLEVAAGRFSGQLKVKVPNASPQGWQVTLNADHPSTYQVCLCKGKTPVYAWWLPESVSDDPVWGEASLACWMDKDLELSDPVVINPATQEVFSVHCEIDRKACPIKDEYADPKARGILFFPALPISNSPLILTDRSIVSLS